MNCSYCDTELLVEYSEGSSNVKLAEQVTQSIDVMGKETSTAIRDGSSIAKTELQKLQIGQNISSLQIQLSNIQSEIRMLERERKSRKSKKQLKELYRDEKGINSQIRTLQKSLSNIEPLIQQPVSGPKSKGVSIQTAGFLRNTGRGCLASFIIYLVLILLIPASLIPSEEDTVSNLYMILNLIFFTIAVITFIYFRNPENNLRNLFRALSKV